MNEELGGHSAGTRSKMGTAEHVRTRPGPQGLLVRVAQNTTRTPRVSPQTARRAPLRSAEQRK
jgi:hypothetical protein